MEFDPGPPPAFASLFEAVPDHEPHREDFWIDWGPIFYRGRLDGTARLVCIASDPGPTERIAGRTLVGDAGQRVQGFLAKLGLTRSYLCLNAFVFGMFPSHFFRADEILAEGEQATWRNAVFDLAKTPQVQAVVAFGANARFDAERDVFDDRELVATATRDAARILHWEAKLGTIEAGKRADLLVLTGREGDPYGRLLNAKETSVRLVTIDGIPRGGAVELMGEFELGAATERWSVDASERLLLLRDEAADPLVAGLTLQTAAERLDDAMQRLPELAEELEGLEGVLAPAGAAEPTWMLLLDHEEPMGLDQRPHLPGPDGLPTAELTLDLAAASIPLSELLVPMELDAATVADDSGFVDRLVTQTNMPPEVAEPLRDLY